MVQNGPYPEFLKERILSPRGHQSNATCAELLRENWHPGLKNVFLCHLSQENNDPMVAYATVSDALEDAGAVVGEDVFLKTLSRTEPSKVYELTDVPCS